MITTYKIPVHSEKWYKFRENGVGSSETGQLVYPEHQYSNLAKLFHEKVGIMDIPPLQDNEAMFWGRHDEEYIANVWQYWWDGEYMSNYKNKNKIRKCRATNSYAVNDKYPMMFSSVDRMIVKGMPDINGVELKDGGILEIKTVNEYSAKEWADGIPEFYVAQVQQQMLVHELDYAELCAKIGGNKLKVYSFKKDQKMQDIILYNAYHFWEDHVRPAKELAKDYWKFIHAGELEKAEEVAAAIDRYEPMPQGTKSYRNFVLEKREQRGIDREYANAPEGALLIAQQDAMLAALIKKLTNKREEKKNTLIKMLTEEKAEKFNFESGDGLVSFAGSFRNKLKADEEQVKRIIEEMEVSL